MGEARDVCVALNKVGYVHDCKRRHHVVPIGHVPEPEKSAVTRLAEKQRGLSGNGCERDCLPSSWRKWGLKISKTAMGGSGEYKRN